MFVDETVAQPTLFPLPDGVVVTSVIVVEPNPKRNLQSPASTNHPSWIAVMALFGLSAALL